jgi:hypothetical protein
MATQKINLSTEVTKLLDDLKHPLRKEIEQLRLIILSARSGIAENIKWNGPNYSFENNDRISMRVMPPKQLQLIFHRGAKVKAQPKDKLIKDTSGLMVWKENDRAIMTFKSATEIADSKKALTRIVKDWVDAAS